MWITHTGHFLYVIKMLTIISFRFFLLPFYRSPLSLTHYHTHTFWTVFEMPKDVLLWNPTSTRHLCVFALSLLHVAFTMALCAFCCIFFTFSCALSFCTETQRHWNFKHIPELIYCATDTRAHLQHSILKWLNPPRESNNTVSLIRCNSVDFRKSMQVKNSVDMVFYLRLFCSG